jgi:hypothetical protein
MRRAGVWLAGIASVLFLIVFLLPTEGDETDRLMRAAGLVRIDYEASPGSADRVVQTVQLPKGPLEESPLLQGLVTTGWSLSYRHDTDRGPIIDLNHRPDDPDASVNFQPDEGGYVVTYRRPPRTSERLMRRIRTTLGLTK